MPGNRWNSIWPRSPIYDANVSDTDRDASPGMLAKVDATLVLCGHIPSPREYRDQVRPLAAEKSSAAQLLRRLSQHARRTTVSR